MSEEKRSNIFIRTWEAWSSLFDLLPNWLFSPEPVPASQDVGQLEHYKKISERQEAIHDELSKTIRRIYYALVGTCIFCILTLSGTPDAQIIIKGANVTLPILNYPIGFNAFLVVGPVILVGLWVYLHIFIGEIRLQNIPSDFKQPTLPNFNGWGARIVVLLTLYWMVPITLAVFTWKAWPSSSGEFIYYTTAGFAAFSVLLQMRRCPRIWRGWGLPLLILSFAAFFTLEMFMVDNRYLSLYKQELQGKDLENARLNNADMRKANLINADLSRANLTAANLSLAQLSDANLSRANLSAADLTAADLTAADLSSADLTAANLSLAQLSLAQLRGADLSDANLTFAKLTGADLSRADLSDAKLIFANLSRADLGDADLSGADLSNANLTEANLSAANLGDADLSGADLSGADLSVTVVVQLQLNLACGNQKTKLPKGMRIKACPE